MSRTNAKTICMFAATLALSLGCPAQSPRVIAQKLEDLMDQAWINHDLNHVLGFYDPSYVFTDEHGKREAYAEFRKRWEENFSKFRNVKPTTTVEDVRLEAGRMVVNYKHESLFEFHDQRYGWVDGKYNSRGEETWERRGGQWKVVRETVFHVDSQQNAIQNLVRTCQWSALQCSLTCKVSADNRYDPRDCIKYCEGQKQRCLASLCETDLRRSYPSLAQSVCGR